MMVSGFHGMAVKRIGATSSSPSTVATAAAE